MQRRIYRRNGLSSERENKYRQHIRQPQYQQMAFEEHLRTDGDEKFRNRIYYLLEV